MNSFSRASLLRSSFRSSVTASPRADNLEELTNLTGSSSAFMNRVRDLPDCNQILG